MIQHYKVSLQVLRLFEGDQFLLNRVKSKVKRGELNPSLCCSDERRSSPICFKTVNVITTKSPNTIHLLCSGQVGRTKLKIIGVNMV